MTPHDHVGPMVAVNVDQPYASLIAHGIKPWETRPYPPAGWPGVPEGQRRMPGVRVEPGETVLIVSNRKRPSISHLPGFTDITGEPRAEGHGCAWLDCRSYPGEVVPLPLGAVVAVARITDVVPILGVDDPHGRLAHVGSARHAPDRLNIYRPTTGRYGGGSVSGKFPSWEHEDISDQLPYGDWSPGRWAWRLDDVRRLTEPVTEYPCRVCGDPFTNPVSGRQGVWRPDPALVEAVMKALR